MVYSEKNIRKKIADVNRYIRIGLRYRTRRPITYSFDRKPGLKTRSFKEVKNLPSKWVTSLKKWETRCHTLSFGSIFSCPQLWQKCPITWVSQFKQFLSFRCGRCDNALYFCIIKSG